MVFFCFFGDKIVNTIDKLLTITPKLGLVTKDMLGLPLSTMKISLSIYKWVVKKILMMHAQTPTLAT